MTAKIKGTGQIQMAKDLEKKTEAYKRFTPSETKILTAIWELTENNYRPVSYGEIANYLGMKPATLRQIVARLMKNKGDLLTYFHIPGGVGRSPTFLRLSENIVGRTETALIALELLDVFTNNLKLSDFVNNIHEKYELDISEIEDRINLLDHHKYIKKQKDGLILPSAKLWEQKDYLEFVAQKHTKKPQK